MEKKAEEIKNEKQEKEEEPPSFTDCMSGMNEKISNDNCNIFASTSSDVKV